MADVTEMVVVTRGGQAPDDEPVASVLLDLYGSV